MSLNYDLTKVKDFEALDPDVTQTMIFTTMGVGIGDLTEKNAHEFYARSRINSVLWGIGENDPVTPEVVHAYIGLKTNVSYETPARWSKRTIENSLGTYQRKYWDTLKKLEEVKND